MACPQTPCRQALQKLRRIFAPLNYSLILDMQWPGKTGASTDETRRAAEGSVSVPSSASVLFNAPPCDA